MLSESELPFGGRRREKGRTAISPTNLAAASRRYITSDRFWPWYISLSGIVAVFAAAFDVEIYRFALVILVVPVVFWFVFLGDDFDDSDLILDEFPIDLFYVELRVNWGQEPRRLQAVFKTLRTAVPQRNSRT